MTNETTTIPVSNLVDRLPFLDSEAKQSRSKLINETLLLALEQIGPFYDEFGPLVSKEIDEAKINLSNLIREFITNPLEFNASLIEHRDKYKNVSYRVKFSSTKEVNKHLTFFIDEKHNINVDYTNDENPLEKIRLIMLPHPNSNRKLIYKARLEYTNDQKNYSNNDYYKIPILNSNYFMLAQEINNMTDARIFRRAQNT